MLWGLCPLTAPLSLQGVFANHPITPVRVCRYHPCSLLSQGAPSVHSPIYCQVCLVVICEFVSEFVVKSQFMGEYLKANKVQCVPRKATKKLCSYGSKQPLRVAGTFTADVSVGKRVLNEVKFVVIKSEGYALLGRESAIALGVLKLGPQINSLQLSPEGENRKPSILEKFPGCCEGIGKLKNFQLKIPTDAEVQPVAQPIRRVPYHALDKLTNKLKELVELDIIEKFRGPSSLVSPIVVVGS